MTPKAYVKTLQDELDWKQLDQLSSVVAQISDFCFATKKFCVTTQFVVLAFVVQFTHDKLDDSVFITGLVIPFCFWFLDSTGFFYQVKLRGTMELARDRIVARDDSSIIGADGGRVIARRRVEAPPIRRVLNSAFNHSMWLYALLIAIDVGVWWLFKSGHIR